MNQSSLPIVSFFKTEVIVDPLSIVCQLDPFYFILYFYAKLLCFHQNKLPVRCYLDSLPSPMLSPLKNQPTLKESELPKTMRKTME